MWRPIVSAKWLANELKVKNPVQVIDASFHLSPTRDPRAEFEKERIPTSVFFDIDGCCAESPYPHMAPSSEQLKDYVENLGLVNDKPTVVYDCSDFGIFSSARLWWMLAPSIPKLAVLDGGMKAWKAEGFPVENGTPTPNEKSEFKVTSSESRFVTAENLLEVISNPPEGFAVVDARPAGRFKGAEPEPREGLKSGHIPTSVNIPFAELLVDGKMGDKAHVENVFANAGVGNDLSKKRVVFSCGSGVTACVPLLAAVYHLNAFPGQFKVYDGAFAEWGREDLDFPVVKSL